jgi:hypothetical protein
MTQFEAMKTKVNSPEEVTPQKLLQEEDNHQNTRQSIPIYTVKIIYKSGAIHEFDCKSFEMEGTIGIGTAIIKFEPLSDNNAPIDIGLDEVAAIWQVGVREE